MRASNNLLSKINILIDFDDRDVLRGATVLAEPLRLGMQQCCNVQHLTDASSLYA